MEGKQMCYSCGELFPIDNVAQWKYEDKITEQGVLMSCYHIGCEVPKEKCSDCGLHRKVCEDCCE